MVLCTATQAQEPAEQGTRGSHAEHRVAHIHLPLVEHRVDRALRRLLIRRRLARTLRPEKVPTPCPRKIVAGVFGRRSPDLLEIAAYIPAIIVAAHKDPAAVLSSL